MNMKSAVALYRLSTSKQGKSGLELKAQQETVSQYKNLAGLTIEKEYIEVINGRQAKRQVLKSAIRFCRKNSHILIIAKLDRLAHNVGLIVHLMENNVKFVIADKPLADKWDILRQAVNDEEEGFRISERTRKALQAAKKRGVKLGKNGKKLAEQNKQKADRFAEEMRPIVLELQNESIVSIRAIAKELNRRKVATSQGAKWHKTTVHNLLKRLENLR
jgi:DNA invertase Pin-like site-specific DNA recombinase